MIDSLLDLEFTREYLQRIGAEPRSLYSAIVEKKLGGRYWEDRCFIKFHQKTGKVSVFPKHKTDDLGPTETEQSLIREEWKEAEFPQQVYVPLNLLESHLDERLAQALRDDRLYIFEDKKNEKCLMLEERLEDNPKKPYQKRYVRWSYWNDKRWRALETVNKQGKIPLYGLSQLNEHSIIFLHEGAKSAKYCREELNKSHPWYNDLKDAAHLAWVGGALNPHRTAWKALRDARPDMVYIVPDNDPEGYSAVPYIAKQLDCITYSVQWPDVFPMRFDLGDEFPEKMFKEDEHGKMEYTECTFRECLVNSTYLTKLVVEDGKAHMELRSHAKNLYVHILKADLWVCRLDPKIMLDDILLKKYIRKYHHNIGGNNRILELFNLSQDKIYESFSFRPDKYEAGSPGIVSDGILTFNRYAPGPIDGKNISISEDLYKPWEEFLSYLFPVKEELDHVKRWIATLVAKPEIRMKWGMLMISFTQGVGKSTLGEKILMALVGVHNASVVRESDILSSFNSWAAFKRLIIIEEIYAGQSWKATQALQSLITDPYLTINEKHTRLFTCDNWCHVLACSNEYKALKISKADRRWFFPEITERKWPQSKFDEFYDWLNKSGLAVIHRWCLEYGDYVSPGEHAPESEKKKEIIQESMSQEEIKAHEIGNFLAKIERPFMVSRDDIHAMIEHDMKNQKIYDSDVKIRKAIISGCMNNQERKSELYLLRRNNRIYKVQIKGKRQYVLFNDSMQKIYEDKVIAEGENIRVFMQKYISSGGKIVEKYINQEGGF